MVPINYRPEIDGLRALSVFFIIIYHAKISLFNYTLLPGGFLGVDIFFFISGYLITLLILKNKRKNNFFVTFYLRRARRILPALIVAIIIFTPISLIILLPADLIDYSKSIIFSLSFISNFYFHYTGAEYASQHSLLKPFLHIWSLSIEEQFYIFFPIVVIILLNNFKKYFSKILILTILFSISFSTIISKNHPSFNFYMISSRSFELLLVSLLAFYDFNNLKKTKKFTKILNKILPKIGLLMIIFSILFYNDKLPLPSFYTLIPIIGCIFIIKFSTKDEFVNYILSNKIIIFFGIISYSLYIWHYPIFAFARILDLLNNNNIKVLMILLTIIISIFSYFYIELPFRNKKIISTKKFLILLFISIIFLIIINIIIIKKDGFKKRFPEILQKNLSIRSWEILINEKGESCFNKQNNFCIFNEISNKKTIFLIGDSVVGTMSFNLKERLVSMGYKFIPIISADCIYIEDFQRFESGKLEDTCNLKFMNSVQSILTKNPNSIIIYGAYFYRHYKNEYEDGMKWNYEFKHKNSNISYFNGVHSTIKNLSEANNNIILIYPLPAPLINTPMEIHKKRLSAFLTNDKEYNSLILSKDFFKFKEEQKDVFKFLDNIQSNNIERVYPHSLICNTIIKNRCIFHDSKNTFYIDGFHPSSSFATNITNLIIEKIIKIDNK